MAIYYKPVSDNEDLKILAVLIFALTSYYEQLKDYNNLRNASLESISHFFDPYKGLRDGKWLQIKGWLVILDAAVKIKLSINSYTKKNKSRSSCFKNRVWPEGLELFFVRKDRYGNKKHYFSGG